MKKLQNRGIIASALPLLIFIFAGACSLKSVPLPTATPQNLALSIPTATEADTWQKELANLVKEARKEGRVTIYSSEGGELRSTLVQRFKSQYDIEVEYTSARGPELVPKIVAERNARIYLVDILIGGGAPAVATLKPMGAFDSMEPALVLPEVKDPQNWYGGKIPWMDPKERTSISFLLAPSIPIAINTNLVNSGEISSYRDLLNPKWKGKILIADPIAPGSFTAWVGLVANHLMGVDYLRKLTEQELTVVKDIRLQAEWLAHGKYAIGIAVRYPVIEEFKRTGAPLDSFIPIEGTQLSASSGQIRMVNKAPHPSATKLFINWFLSKEGQTIYSKIGGEQSAREDVPVEHIDPKLRRQPEVKYILSNTEEYLLASKERENLSKEIFGFLVK